MASAGSKPERTHSPLLPRSNGASRSGRSITMPTSLAAESRPWPVVAVVHSARGWSAYKEEVGGSRTSAPTQPVFPPFAGPRRRGARRTAVAEPVTVRLGVPAAACASRGLRDLRSARPSAARRSRDRISDGRLSLGLGFRTRPVGWLPCGTHHRAARERRSAGTTGETSAFRLGGRAPPCRRVVPGRGDRCGEAR